MSSSIWPKPSQEIAIDYNWCAWAEDWSKNSRYTSRDTTKWFCNLTTLDYLLQNGWKPIWKWLNGKYNPNCCIHQILARSIITCSNRWYIAWLCSTFILMKMLKMVQLVVSLKRRVVFLTWNSNAARKTGNFCSLWWTILLQKKDLLQVLADFS